MSNIVIDIAAEFTGKKAFKQADSATQKLSHGAKTLARNLGLAFGTAAILAYSKTAVRAAAADIKGQKQLALALKNVGLERNAASAEAYVQKLQSEFGIVDDLLRPAYADLARATLNSAEAQRLLSIAIDVSAGTGKDLTTVVSALSKAALGSNTALSKLGVGISKADLKTKSFYDVSLQLADAFKGAGAASANTFSGQLDLLTVSTSNAAETIGVSLIGALTSLSKDNSMAGLGKDIESASKSLANFIDSIVYLKGQIGSIPGAGLVNGAFGAVGNVLGRFSPQRAAELLKQIKGQGPASKNPIQSGTYLNNPVATKSNKVATDTLKTNKASLALAKAKATLDLQQIQIVAALKGKISEEDRIALKLQLALLNENATEATKLSEQLTAAKEKNATLATTIAALPKATNPFAEWPTFIQTAIAGLQDGSLTVIEKISAAVQTAIQLTNTVAQQSIQAGIAAGNSLAAALSGARYAGQADAAATAAAQQAAAAAAAAANAALLAGNKATLDAIAKANAEALAKAQADAAASNTKIISDAAATAAQIAADAIDAQATSKAALEKLIAEQNAALATAATNAATAAAALGASSAAANAAQVAADAADAAGIASNNTASTVITVNVGGTVISETDLATVILDTINNAGVAGTQTIINNASLATAG